MKNYRSLVFSLVGAATLFLLVSGAGALWLGGVGPLLTYVNGGVIYLSPRTLGLGDFEPGAETNAVFKMTNLSSKEISVIGLRSSCKCAFSEQVPIVVLPGKTVELKLNVELPKYHSSYDQVIMFMVGEPRGLMMHPVRITATVPNPLPEPEDEEEKSDTESTEDHLTKK